MGEGVRAGGRQPGCCLLQPGVVPFPGIADCGDGNPSGILGDLGSAERSRDGVVADHGAAFQRLWTAPLDAVLCPEDSRDGLHRKRLCDLGRSAVWLEAQLRRERATTSPASSFRCDPGQPGSAPAAKQGALSPRRGWRAVKLEPIREFIRAPEWWSPPSS